MWRQAMKTTTPFVTAVFMIQASLRGIISEDLPNAILRVMNARIRVGIKQKGLRFHDPEVSLSHSSFIPKNTGHFIHQPSRQVARPHSSGLGVLGGEQDRAPIEVEMLELDADKLAHTATEFEQDPEHQFVPVVFYRIEELLEFLLSQIPYGLPKTVIFRGRFHI